MANPKKDLSNMIDASEKFPDHYKEYLVLVGIFVNLFLSNIIFISDLDLIPRIWMRIISMPENHP